jgi:hypothetical protein
MIEGDARVSWTGFVGHTKSQARDQCDATRAAKMLSDV